MILLRDLQVLFIEIKDALDKNYKEIIDAVGDKKWKFWYDLDESKNNWNCE